MKTTKLARVNINAFQTSVQPFFMILYYGDQFNKLLQIFENQLDACQKSGWIKLNMGCNNFCCTVKN